MMIEPPIAKLVEKTGSRYQLAIETAKRARQLSAGRPPLIKTDLKKEVSIAAQEIHEDMIMCTPLSETRELSEF